MSSKPIIQHKIRCSVKLTHCPLCATKMKEVNMQLKDGGSLYGLKCPNCHHMLSRNYTRPSKK